MTFRVNSLNLPIRDTGPISASIDSQTLCAVRQRNKTMRHTSRQPLETRAGTGIPAWYRRRIRGDGRRSSLNAHMKRYAVGCECDPGYRQLNRARTAVELPANAYLTDSRDGPGWACDRGLPRVQRDIVQGPSNGTNTRPTCTARCPSMKRSS